MISQSRPAAKQRGPARRPSREYFNLRCLSCGRQGADVGHCGFCAWTCCVANAHCHKQITAGTNAHWGYLADTTLKPSDLRQQDRKKRRK